MTPVTSAPTPTPDPTTEFRITYTELDRDGHPTGLVNSSVVAPFRVAHDLSTVQWSRDASSFCVACAQPIVIGDLITFVNVPGDGPLSRESFRAGYGTHDDRTLLHVHWACMFGA